MLTTISGSTVAAQFPPDLHEIARNAPLSELHGSQSLRDDARDVAVPDEDSLPFPVTKELSGKHLTKKDQNETSAVC